MQKIFTLVAAMALVASAAQAQRITGITVKDNGVVVKPLNDFAAFNPNKDTGKGGAIECVFLPDQQLSNLNIELTFSTDGGRLADGVTLPTDFSETTDIITVTNDAGKTAEYKITFKNIKAYSGDFPFKVNFSSTNHTVWDNTVEGWAAACIDDNTNMVRFSGPSARTFILGLTEVPGDLSFKGYYEPKSGSTGMQDGETITVQTNDATLSGDWNTVMTFDKNNPLATKEAFSTAEPYKVEKLDSKVRYIRFVANRQGSSLCLNSFMVTKGKETAISDNMAAQTSAFVNGKELSIINAAEVAKVEVINVAGQSVLAQAQPTNSISLNALSDGVYLVRLTMVDGSAVTTKVAIK